jgi:hypothetical protein
MARSQYVEEIGPGQWRGIWTGHEYDHRSIDAAETLERREAIARDARTQPAPEHEIERLLTPGSSLTHNQTAELLRPHIEAAMATNTDMAIAEASRDEMSACIEMFPEVMDTEFNGAQIRNFLDLQGIKSPWSANHYAAAIKHLSTRGLLQLDQKVLNEKKRAEVRALAERRGQAQFDEEEAYALPLQEIERRARGTYIR